MTLLTETGLQTPANNHSQVPRLLRYLRSNPLIAMAALVLIAMIGMALLAPLLAPHDPQQLDSLARLKGGSAEHPLGTDSMGRDLLSRVIHGSQISLAVGIGAAALSVAFGLVLGLLAGYFRAVDAVLMRLVDAMMAMPNILLAVSIVALVGANLWTVLIAITIPEVPRVVRLVRSVVLTVREEPYVEAARTLGVPTWRIVVRHLMPNTIAPLVVQGSYICAAAILTESILSFLGAGISPVTPTWGNIMADGRSFFRLKPELIFWPGLCVSATILAINLIGDALRDSLDPRLAKRSAER
jgi:peptide/nickel transport system permease protein